MRALGNYLMCGKIQAAGVIVTLALVSLLLPPAAYILSGTPLGLVTLRKGSYTGLQVWVGASLLFILIGTIVQLPAQFTWAYALFLWLPIWLCASALRWSGQQGMLIAVAGLLATLILAALYLALGDATAWQDWLNELLIERLLPADKKAEYKELILPVAEFINAFLAAGLMLNIITAVLLSRWWQAVLFNPDGFRKEFYQLQLPVAALVCVMLGLIALFAFDSPWNLFARDVLIIMIFMFLFQGLALTHRTVAARKLPRFWLILLYFSLLLIPQIVLLLACVGMVDNWLTNRKRQLRGGDV